MEERNEEVGKTGWNLVLRIERWPVGTTEKRFSYATDKASDRISDRVRRVTKSA